MIRTTMGVEGMACAMCEAHVQDAVRSCAGVKRVNASRRKRACVVESDVPLDETALRAVIDGIGYRLTTIEVQEVADHRGFGFLRR